MGSHLLGASGLGFTFLGFGFGPEWVVNTMLLINGHECFRGSEKLFGIKQTDPTEAVADECKSKTIYWATSEKLGEICCRSSKLPKARV